MSATVLHAEHLLAAAGWCRTRRPRTRRRAGCGARRSRTCRDASRRRSPARRGARTRPRTARRSARRSRERRGSPVPSPSSTSASTATGTPSWPTMSGLTSTLVTSGRSTASRPSPTSRSTRRVTSTPRLRRGTRPSSFCVASVVDHLRGRRRGRAAPAGTRRRRPPRRGSRRRPSITVGPNWRSRSMPAISSRLPATIGATSNDTSPSDGTRRGQQLGRRRPHGCLVAEPQAHETTFGLVGDRVAAQLDDHREADRRRAAAAASSALDDVALVGERQPVSGQQPLRGGLRQRRRRRVVIAGNGSRAARPRDRHPRSASAVRASARLGRTRARGRCGRRASRRDSVGASSSPSMNGASEK